MAVRLASNAGLAARIAAQVPLLGFAGVWRWRVQQALHWWFTSLGSLIPSFLGKQRHDALAPSSDQCLAFSLDLPAEALGTVEDLLALEVENRTPFQASDVLVAYRLEPTPVSGTVRARAALIRRDGLDATPETKVRALGLPDGAGGFLHVPFGHVPFGSAKNGAMGVILAAGLCAVLTATALVLPFLLLDRQQTALNTDIAQVQADAREAIALRRDILSLTQGQSLAVSAKGTTAPAVAILADLTDHIPDTAYLTQITMEGPEIRIQGFARDAADVLARLAEAPGFDNVRFTSPVSLDAQSGTETVQVGLTLSGYDGGQP